MAKRRHTPLRTSQEDVAQMKQGVKTPQTENAAYRLAFAIAFLPQPGFGFALLQTLWSVLCYPVVVAASRFAFDLRKPATGEVDAYGRRL